MFFWKKLVTEKTIKKVFIDKHKNIYYGVFGCGKFSSFKKNKENWKFRKHVWFLQFSKDLQENENFPFFKILCKLEN